MSYTAAVLRDTPDRRQLIQHLSDEWFVGHNAGMLTALDKMAHHVTLHMGPPNEFSRPLIGRTCWVEVNGMGSTHGIVYAARVASITMDDTAEVLQVPHKKPHITMYVNRSVGAKPREANDIEHWYNLPAMTDGSYLLEAIILALPSLPDPDMDKIVNQGRID